VKCLRCILWLTFFIFDNFLQEFEHIIGWMPHGRSWRVHKPKPFEEIVIPQFFISCKYTSFLRQANGWGFRRVTQGPDRNAYYHSYFLKGRQDLCRLMRRPGIRAKKPIDPRQEPNFYAMPPIQDDPKVRALANKNGSGNRAVKDAEKLHEKLCNHGGEPCRCVTGVAIGEENTLDVEDVEYAVNADPLLHYEYTLGLKQRK